MYEGNLISCIVDIKYSSAQDIRKKSNKNRFAEYDDKIILKKLYKINEHQTHPQMINKCNLVCHRAPECLGSAANLITRNLYICYFIHSNI